MMMEIRYPGMDVAQRVKQNLDGTVLDNRVSVQRSVEMVILLQTSNVMMEIQFLEMDAQVHVLLRQVSIVQGINLHPVFLIVGIVL